MWPGVNYGYRPDVYEGPYCVAGYPKGVAEVSGIDDYGTGEQWRQLRPRMYVDNLGYEVPAYWT